MSIKVRRGFPLHKKDYKGKFPGRKNQSMDLISLGYFEEEIYYLMCNFEL